MAGLGQYEALIGVAADYFMSEDGGSGGAPGGAMPSRTDVTTTTQVQVSPQISPIFTQQFQPSGSPVNAGATMAPTGTVPNTGYMPGFDYASGFWPTGTPGIPTQQEGFNVPPQVLIAGLALAGLFAFTRAKRSARRRR
jgi:hypothetical protein